MSAAAEAAANKKKKKEYANQTGLSATICRYNYKRALVFVPVDVVRLRLALASVCVCGVCGRLLRRRYSNSKCISFFIARSPLWLARNEHLQRERTPILAVGRPASVHNCRGCCTRMQMMKQLCAAMDKKIRINSREKNYDAYARVPLKLRLRHTSHTF